MQCKTTLFQDRRDAAMHLKEHLPIERMRAEKWSLVAVSRGGLDLAAHLCERYGFALDILFSEAIYAPYNLECEIARVSETEEIVMHDRLVEAFGIKLDYIYGEASRKFEEKILGAIYKRRKGRPFETQSDKTVLLIDEGSESGLRLMTAVKTVLAQNPRAVYLAVPVIPDDVVETLEPLVDGIFYVYSLEDYMQTENYYCNFEHVSDERIVTILGG